MVADYDEITSSNPPTTIVINNNIHNMNQDFLMKSELSAIIYVPKFILKYMQPETKIQVYHV
jgi:hypothetical protein